MTKADDAARLEPSAYPLIVFVHVPKTAGNTIKLLLYVCTPRARADVQLVIDDRAAFLDLARNCDWISGHVPRDSLAKDLTWLDRPVEYFSSVREPVTQLVSYLNYSFERFSRSNYYDMHKADEQQLDAEVISTDFTKPAAVMNLLLRRAKIYLNVQSRFVVGNDFAVISDEEIARRLATYTYVASEDSLPKLYRAFGFAQLPEGADEIRENVAKRYIDAQVFDTPQLREFLARHNSHDLRLYAAVRRTSWPAEQRRPFRPAFMGLQATFENFDEQIYLDCNLDVANAVKQGDYQSGRAHFERHGCNENRLLRRWVLPPAATSKQRSMEADYSISSVLGRLRRVREERKRIAANLQLRGTVGSVTGQE